MTTSSPIDRPFHYFALVVFTLSIGCQHSIDYQASALPRNWRASPASNVVDPSGIARKSRNSDLIYPGDRLDLVISTGIEEREPTAWSLRVSETGEIDIPLIGPVNVAGLELPEAEMAIHRASVDRDVFVRPSVSLAIKERHRINVRVVGEVANPGNHPIDADGADLLAALVAAGWLTESADTVVELKHPAKPSGGGSADGRLASHSSKPVSPRSVKVDLVAASKGRAANHHVEDGTVVSVLKRRRSEVFVSGLVRKPDAYEISPTQPTRVLDVVARAGDRTMSIADRIHVKRRSKDGSKAVTIHVPYHEAKKDVQSNLVLQPGDVVTVEETPATFLVDTIRSFVRFGFSSTVPSLFQ